MKNEVAKFKYEGQMLTIAQLMLFCVVSKTALRDRLSRGWDMHSALFQEARPKGVNAGYSKHSVDADISAKEKSDKIKIREIGMFAQCSRRTNSK